VAALTLAPLSLGQPVLAGGLVFLPRAAGNIALTSLANAGARILLGIAAGLGFGISDVAVLVGTALIPAPVRAGAALKG
jgi:hypothetical protein